MNVKSWRAVPVLVFSSLSVMGCRAMTTPEQIASLLPNNSPWSTSSITCRSGERGWDYICQEHIVPTAAGASHGNKVEDRRVGVHLEASAGTSFLYGKPGFVFTYLPETGAFPSWEESQAKAQAYADEMAAKARKASNR